MRKNHFRFLSMVFFILGITLLLNSKIDIAGAVVGILGLSSMSSPLFGAVFIFISFALFVSGESLEERLENEHHWRKYPVNKDSIIQDVEQAYLSSKDDAHQAARTPLQEGIEIKITGG